MADITTTLVLTVLLAVCLLGGVHAVNILGGEYLEELGRHNITSGTKRVKDIKLYCDEPKMSKKPLQTRSNDLCYPDLKENKSVHINYYSVVAVNNEGLAYMSHKHKSDARRVCFHLKTLRGEGYHFKVEVWGTKN